MDELTRLKLPICLNHDLSAQGAKPMDLLGLVIVLIVIGAALAIVPMDPPMKKAIMVVVLVVVALVILRAFLPRVVI